MASDKFLEWSGGGFTIDNCWDHEFFLGKTFIQFKPAIFGHGQAHRGQDGDFPGFMVNLQQSTSIHGQLRGEDGSSVIVEVLYGEGLLHPPVQGSD